MLLKKRTLTVAEIAARRRNAQKSTGPRTPHGKRRAALNSLKHHLLPRWRALLIAAKGQDSGDYGRLHCDLLALLQPCDHYFRFLVKELVEVWWEKLCWLRGEIWGPKGRPVGRKLNHEIESQLMTYVTALSLQSRKWNYQLVEALGGPVATPGQLRRKIEAHFQVFSTLRSSIQLGKS